MIEGTRCGENVWEALALGMVDEDGAGGDVHEGEEGAEEACLLFAIAVPSLEDTAGISGDVAVLPLFEAEVADFVLDKAEGKEGALFGIEGGHFPRVDEVDHGRDVILSDVFGEVVEWGVLCGNSVPGGILC